MSQIKTRSVSSASPKTPKEKQSSSTQNEDIKRLVQNMTRELRQELQGQEVRITAHLSDIKTSMDQLRTEMRSEIARIDREVSEVKETIKADKENLQTQINNFENKMEDIAREIQTQEKKRNNIMLFGIPSGKWEQLDELFEDIIKELDVKLMGTSTCTVTTRQERAPIRVTLSSREDKMNILKKATHLRLSAKYQAVFITPDLTYKQRLKQRECVNLAKELTLHTGQKHVVKNFEVIQKSK